MAHRRRDSCHRFRNRSLGQVNVGAGEKLVVNTTGQVLNPAIDENIFSNYGLIDVLGTEQSRAEIDFNHSGTGVTGTGTTRLLKFTVIPLTRLVTVQLL